MQYNGTAILLLVNPIETIAPHAPFMYLSSEKKAFCYQLCSTHYSAERINNWTFVIKVATIKITDNKKKLMEATTCLPLNWHFSWWTKINGTQRRAVLSPWRRYCMYISMAKGTSQAEATSNSKKIKPVALAIVELHKSESIRQAVSQLLSQSVENSVQ